MLDGPTAQIVGAQRPRLALVPPHRSTAGDEAVELAASVGLHLDDWQSWLLHEALGEDEHGRWSAFEVGVVVPRQNGKGGLAEARELAGLFLFGEKLILHSAHEFKTAAEAFLRIKALIDGSDDLGRHVLRMRTSHGDEGIELRSGARLRFVARSTGSGRGFSGDLNVMDEAYNLGAAAMSALLPTMSARPNPQLWYTSSAGFRSSEQLGAVRRRALETPEAEPRLAFFEWSASDDDDQADPETWAKANPALGIRISLDYVAMERRALGGGEEWARERLGIGDWPVEAGDQWDIVDRDLWLSRADANSEALDPVAFAIDINPERTWASIAVAGRRSDGLMHHELVAHREGVGWVVPWIVERTEKWSPCAVVVDKGSPAGSLLPALEKAHIEVQAPTGQQVAAACGAFEDAVRDGTLRYKPRPELDEALAGAKKRNLGDGAWAFARKGLSIVISPAVALALAGWGHATFAPPESEPEIYEL